LDDFQVRTPTDVLGQHIHLVKFDVTSSDGSANGWNYEDGSLALPQRVHVLAEGLRRQVLGETVGQSRHLGPLRQPRHEHLHHVLHHLSADQQRRQRLQGGRRV